PQPKMIFGDPYGFRSHAGKIAGSSAKDDSWYSRMRQWWMDNNPNVNPATNKPMVYPIIANTKNESGDTRTYQARRQALMRWMREKLIFVDTPEVAHTLKAIQNSRWEVKETRVSEQKDAKHDRWSHRRSALEFAAVNIHT